MTTWAAPRDCQNIALAIGDEVTLPKGSDAMLVVDLGPHMRNRVVVAWRAPDGVVGELILPGTCFRFVRSGQRRS